MSLVRFTLKATIAGGIVYYTIQEGLWSTHDESIKLYGKIFNTVAPYVKENVPKEVTDMVPTLPSTTDGMNYVKSMWNGGVLVSMKFLSESPTHLSNGVTGLTKTVKKYIEEQTSTEKPH